MTDWEQRESGRHSRTCILVLGMHRSGTSALTRTLSLRGANLGADLLEVADDNPQGFWEHRDACTIHETLLGKLGRTWHDITSLPAGWQNSIAAFEARASIRQLIELEFADNQLWAIKDPRMCRFASLWIDVLTEMEIRPTAVLSLRNPQEVAASLNERDGWSREHALLMWVQHELEAFAASTNIPRIIVDYDALLAAPHKQLDLVGNELGIEWPISGETAAASIDKFISRKARHHHVENCSVDGIDDTFRSAQKLYELFCKANSQNAHAEVTKLCDDYFKLAPLFSSAIDDLVMRLCTAKQLAVEQSMLIQFRENELLQVQTEVADLKGSIDEAKELNLATERHSVTISKELQEGERKFDLLSLEHQALSLEHRTLLQEHQMLSENLRNSSEQLASTSRALQNIQATSQKPGWLLKELIKSLLKL